jgi:hypothetical protein
MIVVCSIFAFPWCEASTVPAINHVKSLTLASESAAPGDKQRFLGIREQRVTHIVVFILIGKSIGNLLKGIDKKTAVTLWRYSKPFGVNRTPQSGNSGTPEPSGGNTMFWNMPEATPKYIK